MTNLSWVIYLGDVLPNFVGFIIAFCAVCFLAFLAFILGHVIHASVDGKAPNHIAMWKGCKFIIPVVFLAFLTAFIPSKNTIYMIAAAEAGDTILNTPDGQKVMQTLKEIVMKKIDEAAK